MFTMFWFIIILIASLAVSLLITVPLTGALVRLRANYNPKGLQLDPEGNVQPHTGPIVTTFFGMLARVKRIEGWSGLYKGLMPTLLTSASLTIFAVLVLNASNARYNGRVAAPAELGPLSTLIYSVFNLFITLPAVVISYRSITTPYRLPYFRPLYSLRVLLTATERRRPWILYLTPGLFLAQFLHAAYNVLILRSLRKVLLPSPDGLPEDGALGINPMKLGIYIAIEILSTAVLCPLEVVSTKLAIQRNHAATEYNSVEQEVEDDAIAGEEYSGADEDVIGLRHEKDPYLGLVDCVKRIIDEEGWSTLYRAWWLTMLAGLATAFA